MDEIAPEDYVNFVHDRDALARIYDHYYDRIFHYLNRRLWPDTSSALDLTSETFLQMMESAGNYQHVNEKAFAGWIYKIAFSRLQLHFRKANRIISLSYEKLDRESEAIPNEEVEEIYKEYEQNQQFQLVNEAIKDLSIDHQAIIDLRFFEEMSYEEIAEVTGINLGTVKSRINRAIENIQKNLKNVEQNT